MKKQLRSLEDQINRLKNNGLIIDSETEAKQFLAYCNYCRFTEYGYIFKESSGQRYKSDVSFKQIRDLYLYDTELGFLTLEALLFLEIFLRNTMSSIASVTGDMHIAFSTEIYNRSEAKKEDVIKWIAYLKSIPTISGKDGLWPLLNNLSFYKLSEFYALLNKECQTILSSKLNLDHNILETWLFSLAEVRNYSAHAKRLWNAKFKRNPSIPKDDSWSWYRETERSHEKYENKIFVRLTMIKYLLNLISQKTGINRCWKSRLLKQLRNTPPIHNIHSKMGIPDQFQSLEFNIPIWLEET